MNPIIKEVTAKVQGQAAAYAGCMAAQAVATGRIAAAESGRGVVTVKASQALGVGQTAGYDETIANNALRAAISKYVDTIIDRSL